jgi:NAD(P)-dependent dehydrogenase (short-subunit alcohol dehydrogenase family)
MTWELGLEDRGVVVTGGAGGIGRAVASAFAAAGARTAVVDLDGERCREVVGELEQPDRHLAIGADLGDLATHEELLRGVQRTFGRLDALVHLAAVLRRRATIDDVTEEDWDVQLDVNLKATFFLNRWAARLFRE